MELDIRAKDIGFEEVVVLSLGIYIQRLHSTGAVTDAMAVKVKGGSFRLPSSLPREINKLDFKDG
jgi:hypothetical protein